MKVLTIKYKLLETGKLRGFVAFCMLYFTMEIFDSSTDQESILRFEGAVLHAGPVR